MCVWLKIKNQFILLHLKTFVSTLTLKSHISTPLSEAYLSNLTHVDRSPTRLDTCSSAPAKTSTPDACEPYSDIHNYYHCRALSRRIYVSNQAPTFLPLVNPWLRPLVSSEMYNVHYL